MTLRMLVYPLWWCSDGDKCLDTGVQGWGWTGPVHRWPRPGAGVTRWLLLTTLSALSVSPRVSPELSSQLQCQFLWTLATLATPAPAPVSVEHQRRPDQLVREHLDSQ